MSLAVSSHENPIDTDQPAVFLGGIPKHTDMEDLEKYIKIINPDTEFHLVTDTKNRSRGFGFIIFKTQEEAKAFAKIEHVHEKKILDCKISLDHNEHITTSLKNIREPRKVFVDRIPKKFTKHDVEGSLNTYGAIDEVILIAKEKRIANFAYICFSESQSAQKCVDSKELTIDENNKLSFVYARPKFSKRMLTNMPVLLKEYIRQIQKGLKEYDPKDFVSLEVESLQETQKRGGAGGSINPKDNSTSKNSGKGVKFAPSNSDFCKSFTGSTKTSGNLVHPTPKTESQVKYFPPKKANMKFVPARPSNNPHSFEENYSNQNIMSREFNHEKQFNPYTKPLPIQNPKNHYDYPCYENTNQEMNYYPPQSYRNHRNNQSPPKMPQYFPPSYQQNRPSYNFQHDSKLGAPQGPPSGGYNYYGDRSEYYNRDWYGYAKNSNDNTDYYYYKPTADKNQWQGDHSKNLHDPTDSRCGNINRPMNQSEMSYANGQHQNQAYHYEQESCQGNGRDNYNYYAYDQPGHEPIDFNGSSNPDCNSRSKSYLDQPTQDQYYDEGGLLYAPRGQKNDYALQNKAPSDESIDQRNHMSYDPRYLHN